MARAGPVWDPVLMTEQPADIDLETAASPEDHTPPPRHQVPVVALVVAAILLFGLTAAYVFLRRAPAETQAPANVAKPAPAPAVREQIALPPLDETDPVVRELVGKLSANPVVAAWLTTDSLILNFVAVTSRIANGVTPVAELKAIGPVPRFATRTARDNTYIDRSSYRRYDRYAQAVAALDARGVAELYKTLNPRIKEGYARLTSGDEPFDPVLEKAIVDLLKVPVVEGEIELYPHGTVWAFADPRLQEMSAAQKQLLRMGPQNVRTVQGKLREIATNLGIPESRLPPLK
jgi:hypothetical protein